MKNKYTLEELLTVNNKQIFEWVKIGIISGNQFDKWVERVKEDALKSQSVYNGDYYIEITS